MKLKDYIIIALFIWIVLFYTCSDKPVTNTKKLEQENILFKKKVNKLEKQLLILNDSSDFYKSSYVSLLNKKDSSLNRIKTRYITIFDTIQKDTIECLPKIYVDSLIFEQDSINKIASKRFHFDSLKINNLEFQNDLKDSIIENNELIIDNKDIEIKNQKKKKWRFLGIGTAIGYVLGKKF